jgi:hypothetical protein
LKIKGIVTDKQGGRKIHGRDAEDAEHGSRGGGRALEIHHRVLRTRRRGGNGTKWHEMARFSDFFCEAKPRGGAERRTTAEKKRKARGSDFPAPRRALGAGRHICEILSVSVSFFLEMSGPVWLWELASYQNHIARKRRPTVSVYSVKVFTLFDCLLISAL